MGVSSLWGSSRASAELKDVEPDAEWLRATSDDPSLVVSIPWLRPSCLVFELERAEEALDPVLYFDYGQGFTEGCCLQLVERVGSNLYVLLLNEMRGVKRIRLDPASRPLRFRFRAWKIFLSGGSARLRQRLAEVTPGAHVNFLGVGTNAAPQPRPLATGDVKRHYAHVISVASHANELIVPGEAPAKRPFISVIVPTYNTPPEYLRALVRSFSDQVGGGAELIFSDDGSTRLETIQFLRSLQSPQISTVFSVTNQGISAATNAGIRIAKGHWIGFLDHDDALAPFAFAQIFGAIREFPDALMFYTDEVIANAYLEPEGYILKPCFDPVLLSGVNYINHFSVYRKDRLIEIGMLREGFEGSQDYDLVLRYTAGLADHQVVHIPYPAYLWRRFEGSYSASNLESSVANARKALGTFFLSSIGLVAVEPALDKNLHRLRIDLSLVRWPRVSIIIPNKNAFSLLSEVLKGVFEKTDYPSYEVIVVDNGSDDPRVLDLYNRMREKYANFKCEIQAEPFNFSRQVNSGIRAATGAHFLLLNNDIEVLSDSWLKEMVSCLAYPNVGVVGARLLYPNRRVQHAGVIVGLGGLAGHWFQGAPADFPGPFSRLNVRQSMSSVTAACLLVSRTCFESVGPLDEEDFAIAYNDVDFCLRALEQGFRVVWTPFSTMLHHESATRGSDETAKNRERFTKEKLNLRKRHRTEGIDDRYFNPWFTRDRSFPELRLLERLPSPRIGPLRSRLAPPPD